MRQVVTESLRQWILDQARAGSTPESVLAAMKQGGWQEDVALAALEDTLRTVVQAPRAVPFVRIEQRVHLDVGDRSVEVIARLRHPVVTVLSGLLSESECDELIEQSRPHLTRSETVRHVDGDSEVHEARTSRGMFFERGQTPLITRLESRIARLLNWPVDHGEGLQILNYRPGAEYRAHHDYFDPAQPGTPAILKRGGQRVGTLILYLNTPQSGGATTFPDVGFEVAPVKGHAVFFSYDRPHPATATLHAGAPVLSGEKWVATKWLREGVFT